MAKVRVDVGGSGDGRWGRRRRAGAGRAGAPAAALAAEPAPPGAGWWPCPQDPDRFRRHDAGAWTDRTRRPARTRRDGAPSGPPPAAGRGSAVKRGAALQTDRRVAVEWRTFPLSVSYGVAVVAFVVLRGYGTVLSALGLR